LGHRRELFDPLGFALIAWLLRMHPEPNQSSNGFDSHSFNGWQVIGASMKAQEPLLFLEQEGECLLRPRLRGEEGRSCTWSWALVLVMSPHGILYRAARHL
jgi:hypothetical protein